MQKLVVISAPVFTRSGYGDHSVDIILSIIKKYPEWDIKIVPLGWGACPPTELMDNSINSNIIRSRILSENLSRQPDISIHIGIPTEANRFARFNILITAGIETTIADAKWIEACNQMDLILVPSTHSKDVFINSIYDKVDNQNRKVGELRLNKPIEVIFEGIDIEKFFHTNVLDEDITSEIDNIEEDFCFLFVGHWLKGDVGHDRKDVGGMVKVFTETFAKYNKKPALILKTGQATFSILERQQIIQKIQEIQEFVRKEHQLNEEDIPNIYLLHGDLKASQMNSLYNHPKIKAMVSFTKGEGFGRPLLEFGVTKKPIIASGWGGQLDFLSNLTAVLLPGEVKNVDRSAVWDGVILPQSSWFYVSYDYAKVKLKDMFENYGSYDERARRMYNNTVKNFTLDKMADKLKSILDKYINIPDVVHLNLPTLPKLRRLE